MLKKNVRVEPTEKAQEAIDTWHKECQARYFSVPDKPQLKIVRIEPTMWLEEKVDFIIHVGLLDE